MRSISALTSRSDNGRKKQGLIKAARGEITVLDRKGLEVSAGDSYGGPEKEYRRLLGK